MKVILLIDANEDVQHGRFSLRLQDKSIIERVTKTVLGSPPATHNRGSLTIDGIFSSTTIQTLGGGYQSFETSPGDHRGLWWDAEEISMFGHRSPPPEKVAPRKLQVRQASTVRKYNTHLEHLFKKSSLLERVHHLQEKAVFPATREVRLEYEALDKLRCQFIREAENKCRRLRMGRTPFSPVYSSNYKNIRALSLVKKVQEGKRVNKRQLRRAWKGTTFALPMSTYLNKPVQPYLDAEHGERRRIKDKKGKGNRALALRDEWLQGKEESFSTSNSKRSNHFKSMRLREKTRLESARIKRIRSIFKPHGVTKIEVQDEQGEWIEETTQEGVVQGFIKEAVARGSQTTNTPFMKAPLLNLFWYSASSPSVEAFLRGTFAPPPGVDKYVIKMLPHFALPKHTEEAQKISCLIKSADYAKSWSRMNEFTGTGPSGIHFGHFKVLHSSRLSSDIYAAMAEIPFSSGFSPLRWRSCIDHMLQQDQNNFHVDRFRPINFLEADANFNLKLMAKRAMEVGESKGLIAREQYGSRKQHSAETQALNKRLTLDAWRLRKSPGVLCSNDAKSCYDRMSSVLSVFAASG